MQRKKETDLLMTALYNVIILYSLKDKLKRCKMNSYLKNSPLFENMTEEDINGCLRCSGSEVVLYKKEDIIFFQKEVPKKLYILLEGSVAVCSDSFSGKRNIITTFNGSGELFGEVFLFLTGKKYDNYAQAVEDSRVLQMPKDFLYHTCKETCGYHSKLISNMLSILAKKAYHLNQKLQIMSSATLREKIAKVLVKNALPNGNVRLAMNREELADFLNVARPSLSRELMKMQEEGLVTIDKRKIVITNLDELKSIL